jgi:hypothetical protein
MDQIICLIHSQSTTQYLCGKFPEVEIDLPFASWTQRRGVG